MDYDAIADLPPADLARVCTAVNRLDVLLEIPFGDMPLVQNLFPREDGLSAKLVGQALRKKIFSLHGVKQGEKIPSKCRHTHVLFVGLYSSMYGEANAGALLEKVCFKKLVKRLSH